MIISYSASNGTGDKASADVSSVSDGEILVKFSASRLYSATCAALVKATADNAIVTCTGYNYRAGTENAYAYLLS